MTDDTGTLLKGTIERVEGQPEEWRYVYVMESRETRAAPMHWIFDTYTGRGVKEIRMEGTPEAVIKYLDNINNGNGAHL